MFRIWRKQMFMLQPDAFCEHTMQQNATAAGVPPRTPMGELTAPPRSLADFKRVASKYARNGHNFTTIRCNIWLREKRGRGTREGDKGTGRGRGGERGRAAGEMDRGRGEETWNRAADWLRPALQLAKPSELCPAYFLIELTV